MKPGVYLGKKKDGTLYYRASITAKTKHISLGSYDTEDAAAKSYLVANKLLSEPSFEIKDYPLFQKDILFEKFVVLINLRDNSFYIKNPIYLRSNYFLYYISPEDVLFFDIEELFYYSQHKIMRRKGHLFVSDFGMQINILSRYGIKNYAVPGKDYLFYNGNTSDFRNENIEIINNYYGVEKITEKGAILYRAKIHIKGDYIIGKYENEIEAAIAYNKAIDLLRKKGSTKNYQENYISSISPKIYAEIYTKVKISTKIESGLN